ncbi:MAG: hypothetical protein JNM78_15345 [Cyclobacteriaceae bacterium]|nr:hypothetical protein [Cyclobacteriaceae bacterium]
MRAVFLLLVITGQLSCSQTNNYRANTISITLSDKVLTSQKDGETKNYDVDDDLVLNLSDFVNTIIELDPLRSGVSRLGDSA